MTPLICKPILIARPWGGRKLETVLGKTLPPGKLFGQSRELFRDDLRLSVSALDAAGSTPLWVNVGSGATAWYVVQADAGARIYKGVSPGVTREAFAAASAPPAEASARTTAEDVPPSPRLESLPLVAMQAKTGDCHHMPEGVPYAAEGGALIVEIKSSRGLCLPLGSGPASEFIHAIDFGRPVDPPRRRSHVAGLFTTVTRLITCPGFTLEKVRMTEGIEEAIPYDQPVIWVMLEGRLEVSTDEERSPTRIGAGDTFFLPAAMQNPRVKTLTDCVWLEVTVPLGSPS